MGDAGGFWNRIAFAFLMDFNYNSRLLNNAPSSGPLGGVQEFAVELGWDGGDFLKY